jgi:coenzyme PQQ precursor peptide PqqA
MIWQTPSFEEINMSAEIGSYFEDFDGPEPQPFSHEGEAPQSV